MARKIEGRTEGFVLWATFNANEHSERSEKFYLYPSEHTPEGLINELKSLIEFIERNKGADFYSDRAE